MARIKQQSEESKYIKRINEQLSQISKLTDLAADNPLISSWSRAIRESGLKFSKDEGTNRYRIENSAENRAKVESLQRTLAKYKPSTVGDYKAEIKAELEREARQTAKNMTPKAAARYIKKYSSRKAVLERIKIHSIERRIKYMLDVIYDQTGNFDLGSELSQLTKGLKQSERDSMKIYNIFGEISDEFRRIQMGMLTEEEEARANDLEYFKNNPWE